MLSWAELSSGFCSCEIVVWVLDHRIKKEHLLLQKFCNFHPLGLLVRAMGV